ncbi:hypothetical protein CRG98_034660 [Punica granatum]|nr:hypothetical protein CRG98_034660 [Punica granatum]
MATKALDSDIATVDVSIGNIYSLLGRFDQAVLSYRKALTALKSTRGENHPSVASVFIRLADVSSKTRKIRESKFYCENALRVYAESAVSEIMSEEIARGLIEISAIYEALSDTEEALKLLHKAMKLLEGSPGHFNTVAGIEVQMGVIFNMIGRYSDARSSFESAILKLRVCGESKSAFFGIVLNQTGLACLQMHRINEAVEFFEEAAVVLEHECGSCHLETVGVYSNLAATYDALGRVEEAIEILEYIVELREEKLGTVNPDFDEERRRLAQLLKEAGRARSSKGKSLEDLLGSNSQAMKE